MESLILGIDPGSIIGYAVLDIEGKLLKLDSLQNSDLSKIISKINCLGKIVVVGTDINPAPKFVDKFASNFGAKIIVPKNDLLLKYKRKLINNFLKNKDIKIKNKHQLDALAVALIAFKHYQPLFNKIDNNLNNENKIRFGKKIKNTVILKRIPIKKALGDFI